MRAWLLVGMVLAGQGSACDGCGEATPPGERSRAVASVAPRAPQAAPTGIGEAPTTTRALTPAQADARLKPGAPRPVELIAPGDEPRRELRYPRVTAPLRFQLVVEIASESRPHGGASPPDAPLRLELDLDLTPSAQSIGAGPRSPSPRLRGEGRGGGTVEGASILLREVRILPAATALSQELRGRTATLSVDTMGRSVALTPPPELSIDAQQIWSSIESALRALLPPLPREPVGIGASWRSLDRRREAGAELLSWAEHRLESADPPALRSLAREVAAQPRERDPALPADVSLTVIAGSGGGGTLVRWGAGLLPASAEQHHTTRLSLELLQRVPDAGAEVQSAIAVTNRVRGEWKLLAIKP